MSKRKVSENLLPFLILVALLVSLGWWAMEGVAPAYEEMQAKSAKTYKIQMPVGGRLWTPVYYCDEYGYDDSKALVLTDCYRYEEVRIENPVGVVIIKQGGN